MTEKKIFSVTFKIGDELQTVKGMVDDYEGDKQFFDWLEIKRQQIEKKNEGKIAKATKMSIDEP